jgi:glycosyltransferase involved in cell wall biosynthesis
MKKKKLVFILNNFLIGGSERLILEILKNLDRNRFEINIITVFGSGPMEIEFKKLKSPIFFAGPKKYPSSLLFKIIWILSIPFIILRLIVFFKKSKPDVVITSLYSADVLGIFSAWLLRIKKRVVIQHDTHKVFIMRKIFRKTSSLNLAHKIIAVSFTVKKFLVNYFGVSKNKIIVIYNGIDFNKFELGKKSLGSNLILGFIGRFVPDKSPECLLKALVVLKKKYKLEPKVMMAGGGKLELGLKQFVNDNNLENVEFTGWVNDVVKWLKMIDILIIPSKEEGLPLIALEGLASNKIVVASDIEPMKELIISGDNGILFKVGDFNSLSEKLKDLLNNPILVKRYYNNVNQWINENRHLFDIREVSKKYSEYLCL